MRMLSKIVFTAVAAAAMTAPAFAADEASHRFVHEGYTYVYQVKADGKGQRISGTRFPDRAPFSLKVRDGKVSGLSAGQKVAFDVASAQGAANGAKVLDR